MSMKNRRREHSMEFEESEVVSRIPISLWQLDRVSPDSRLYVSEVDMLGFEVTSLIVGALIECNARLLGRDGIVRPLRFQLITDGLGLAQSVSSHLGEGFLLSVACFAPNDSLVSGQVYARVLLQTGEVVSQNVNQLLAAGYVTSQSIPYWPHGGVEKPHDSGGFLRSITGTDPALGVEISETVPAGARWEIQSIRFTLVVSATAAARLVTIVLDDGVNTYFRMMNSNAQTASQTRVYSAFAAGFAAALYTADEVIMLPSSLVLPAGHRIRTLTNSMQADDNFSAPQLFVKQFVN